MHDLPRSIVADDRRIEKLATGASEQLAELRWHWTLDETNPKRVSLRAYARSIGRDVSIVSRYAHGYALSVDDNVNIAEAIERSSMSVDREAATQAVAKARGVAFSTAKQSRPTEVKRVLGMARERVERQGGSVDEHVKRAASDIVKSEDAARKLDGARKRRLGLRFVELEGALDGARRKLETALDVAKSVEWEQEQQELLQSTLNNVRALIDLVDVALAGTPDVDWDAELAALQGDER
jgi:type I site-specific restriction endonuclease